AMRVGLQFIKESPRMRAVIARTVVFFFMTTSIMALLPLTAKRFDASWISTAGTFTLLLASMGLGAVIGALLLPRIREALPSERLVTAGTALQAASITGMALVPTLPLAVACMMLAGVSLVSTANTMGVRAQMALPNWVRARGMAAYLMSIMGGTAIGAAVWGKVAALTSVPTSLMAAAATGLLGMLLVQRLSVDRQVLEDLSPSKAWTPPQHNDPEQGRVVVHIEFIINPDKAKRFRTLMQASRRSRLRQGALQWRLLHSMERPERYVEEIVDASWIEHLRRFDRVTEADVALRELKLAFHVADSPPRVTRFFEAD
ncbi:MAG: MFS transporter, partial [Comamonas sp.]|nr:MFS transporter [Candidatus Comamonas equi]